MDTKKVLSSMQLPVEMKVKPNSAKIEVSEITLGEPIAVWAESNMLDDMGVMVSESDVAEYGVKLHKE